MQITIHVFKCAINFYQIHHIRFVHVYTVVIVDLMYMLTLYSGQCVENKYTVHSHFTT